MSVVETSIGLFYEFGPYRFAPEEHRLYRDGEVVLLPPKELDLLMLLLRHAGQVMGRERLIKALWPDTVVEEANLNVHISALRKALADGSGEQQYIETLPRLGYRFVAPVVEQPAASLPANPVADHSRNAESGAAPAEVKKPAWYATPASSRMALWLLAVGLIGILAFLLLKPAGSTPSDSAGVSPLNVAPLTTYPGHESRAAFSPDGNQIAFVWTGEKENNTDLYVRLVEGGNWVRVTSHPGDDLNPVWSPNGRALAFYRRAPEGDGIYVVPSLGGAERKLAEAWANRFDFGVHTWLDWSPNGKWLVTGDKASAAEPFSLFLLSPETGEKRRLTAPPNSIIGDCSPAFSPDGKWLAFVRVFSAVVGEVHLVSTEGGEPKRLTFGNAGISNLAWAAGGREIIFSERQGGRSRLFRLPVDGGGPQWLAASGADAQYPAFSPHGNRLAWTQNTDHTDIIRLALKGPAAAPASLIASTANEVSPRYSPDGKRIAFVSTRSGSDEIWVSDSNGENPVQLTAFRGPLAGSPGWSPDGKQIVFDCRPAGNADLYAVNSEGGQPRRLTTDPADDIVPNWSHDGRWIYFSSSRGGRLQIWKLAVESGEAVQLTQQGGFEPKATPDGQWVYFARDRGDSAIWRIPVNGGTESFVHDSHQKNSSRMWTVALDGLYFAATESKGRTAIRFFSLSEGRVKAVAEFDGNLPNGVSGLALSPDGNWLLVPQAVLRGSDLMMIENFR